MKSQTDTEQEVPNGRGKSIAIVAGSWHQQVMGGLIAGACALLEQAQAEYEVISVPGTFELPIVAAKAATKFDAVVALGVVIRGGTPHFEYVCQAATDGITRAALDTGVPIGFGVLTCDTEEQALDRAGLPGSSEDKGREAAHAALSTLLTLEDLDRRGQTGGLGFAT